MSIKPRFANAILDGDKTVELRRKAPTQAPPTVVIYGSGSERRVLGTAHLDAVHTATPDEIWSRFGERTGVTRGEFDEYFAGSAFASALELSGAYRMRARVDLEDLRELGVRPPQSWRYLSNDVLKVLLHGSDPASPSKAAAQPDRSPDQTHAQPLAHTALAPRVIRRLADPLVTAAAFAVPCAVFRWPRFRLLTARCATASPTYSTRVDSADLTIARRQTRPVFGADLI